MSVCDAVPDGVVDWVGPLEFTAKELPKPRKELSRGGVADVPRDVVRARALGMPLLA